MYEMKFSLVGIVLIFLLAIPQLAVTAESSSLDEYSLSNQWQRAFEEQIEQWISEIANKDTQFAHWLNSTVETYPFGPGQRQWVVIILNQEREEIGYLIVEQPADQPNFYLIEYGQSEESILSRELQDDPLFLKHHFFYSGLLWAKTEDERLVDLLTREIYEHVSLKQVTPFWLADLSGAELTENKNLSRRKQDPILFLSSALARQEAIKGEQLQEDEGYFYRAQLLPNVIGLYSVTSLHYWEELEPNQAKKLYIGLEDEGIRYFSSTYLNELGTFQRKSD